MTPTGEGLPHKLTKSQFVKMGVEDRLEALYDILMINREEEIKRCLECIKRYDTCAERFVKIEKRKYFDKGVSAITGFIGGAFAGLFKGGPDGL